MNGLVRSFNPVEGGPAVWLGEPIREARQVLRFARELRDYPDGDGPVDIVVDGCGGRTDFGADIYSIIRECPRRTRMTILDAPSMAGVIAMAGDERRIVRGGTIFLHGAGYAASQVLNGAPGGHMPAATLRALARNCDATDAAHEAIFARATGLDFAEVRRMRADETTIGADEAVFLGFVHFIVEVAP